MPVPVSSSSRAGQGSIAGQVASATDAPGTGRPRRVKKNNKKGQEKGQGKGKGKGKGEAPKLPVGLEGCRSTTNNGEMICFAFNLPGGCYRPVTRGRCEKGLHTCAKDRMRQAALLSVAQG